MPQAIAYTYKTATNHLNFINAFLLISIATMLCLYGFGLFSIVSDNFSMRANEKEIAKVSASIGKLEGQYMEFIKGATLENLSRYNLHQAKVSTYIDTSIRLGMSRI